jgi:tRNA dimethylallyltransferase
MMEAGLLDEAQALYPYRHLKALQTVGYQELFEHFDGNYSLAEAVEKIRQHTRNYAKRQMTWFRKDKGIEWMSMDKA